MCACEPGFVCRQCAGTPFEVIDSWGSGKEAIGDSPYILDWKNLGREYTWTIWDFKKGEVIGTITGKLLDKGYVDGGDYKSDAELAE